MRAAPSPLVVGWVDAQPPAEVWLTSITAAELRYGVARLPAGRRRNAIQKAVAALLDEDFFARILPFDADSSVAYGLLAAERERSGNPMGMADCQIAAICRSKGASLATRNIKDFIGTGVELVDPWHNTR